MKNTEFIAMVYDDISRCEETLNTNRGTLELLTELMGKYSEVSSNFPKIQINPLMYKMHSDMPSQYVRMIYGFLKAYHLNNCEDYIFDESKNGGINVITNISNNNENNVKLDTFAEIKSNIENLSSLPEPEIEEILSRVEELEKIINSSERKTKKWEKAKEILKWVADKGVDVGIALLPAFLQIK